MINLFVSVFPKIFRSFGVSEVFFLNGFLKFKLNAFRAFLCISSLLSYILYVLAITSIENAEILKSVKNCGKL